MKRLLFLAFFVFLNYAVIAENVDPYNTGEKYAWSENTGWINAKIGSSLGMQIHQDKVTGWLWGENIGWINLHCENRGTCGSTSFGVVNNGSGRLSGYAWGENVGWINFDPAVPGETRINEYCVRINSSGKLAGWAWGENIGWIKFDENADWDIRVCVVSLEDLANFAGDWLQSGAVPANLDGTGAVNLADFDILSSLWLNYCPDGWQLKN